MLLSVENPFITNRPRNKEGLRMCTPFSNIISPFQTYAKALELNAKKLKQRFPTRSLPQLKQMLQELENDIQMASALIQEEDCASKITTTQKVCQQVSAASLVVQKSQQSEKLDVLQSQNKVLKRAFLKLHYKFLATKQKLQQQQKTIHEGTIQINRMKTINQLLLQQKFKDREEQLNNLYIC